MASHPPSNESPTVPGSVLAGKYRVDRIIGQGGMGVVVEARHIQLDDRVALKFLIAEYATHPEASQRFLREAQAARKIKSEHIARVSDHGNLENGAPYMVMEFLEGRDLSKMLELTGVLPIQDAVDYVIQGCDALAEAHAIGIVHRDIKPANLFLTSRANGMPLVKVLDFGISKPMGGQVDSLTRTTASMGSALYMSPEQMQQTRSVDHRTDIYALGISLYELLAGKQPFYADTLPQLCAEIFTGTPTPIRSTRPEVPEGLAWVLERAYARDRAQRFQTVGEFVVALAPYAPARSQAAIESIAKLQGLPVPIAGAPPAGGPPAPPPPYGVQGGVPGGTQAMPGYAPPVGLGTDPGRPSAPSGLPQTTGTGVSVVAAAPAPPASSSKGPVIALALVGVLLLGGGSVFMATRGRASDASTTPATQAPAAPPPETAATPPPAAPTETAPAATAAPTPTPSATEAAPTATAAATPTPTTAARAPATGGHHAGAPAKTPPAKAPGAPPGAPKSNDVAGF
jgi:serine/threonine-protein kinase